MISNPRRRVALVCAAALIIGLAVSGLVVSLTNQAYRLTGGCGAPPSSTSLCATALRHPSITRGIAVLLVVVVLLAFSGRVAGWCLSPLRALVEPIAQVGPQNLGYRIRLRGDDELPQLGRAIDEMMDRIAAGYEGQRRFAANASHELRTPLAVQRTLIEVGLAQPLTPEQIQLLTRQLLRTNERNEQLIEGLLVLSESDQGLAARTPQRLDEITAAVVAAHQERAAAAGLTLSADLRERTVPGEQVLLERLVTNLVRNAIAYNRPGGTVDVRVGDSPALSVDNTGPVIPPEAVARLFEPFRRLSTDRIDHSGGCGLGLTIARSIVQAHGGTISAVPLRPDGLRVDVRLPQPR